MRQDSHDDVDMIKTVPLALIVLLIAGCVPSASSPSPSPSSVATSAAPTPTALPPTALASPTAEATPITLPSFATIAAPSGDVAWVLVAGSRLFRSSDRGATWGERTVPRQVPIGDIAFADDREGWLSAPGPAATQCMAQAVAIWHTADG